MKPIDILFGKQREFAEANETCMTCGERITEFRDQLSEKEYEISFMCQKCQDSVFEIKKLRV